MPSENLKKYLAVLSGDPERLKSLMDAAGPDATRQQQAAILDAAREGIVLTEADFAVPPSEVPQPETAGPCLCVVGGGGDLEGRTCACAALGFGFAPGGCSCSCVAWGHGA